MDNTSQQNIDGYLSLLLGAQFPLRGIRPEHTWDICRVLGDGELVNGSDRHVGTLEVGPFRLAVTGRRSETVRVFLFSVVPGLVRSLVSELSLLEAVVESLIVGAELCVDLSQRLIVIEDTAVWMALIYIKRQNQIGRFPTRDELVLQLGPHLGLPDNVEGVIDRIIAMLLDFPGRSGDTRHTLIEMRMDGSFRTLV